MDHERFIQILVKHQNKTFNAHTVQIVDLVRSNDNNDDAIKMLIDERRNVYNEFEKRIKSYHVTN